MSGKFFQTSQVLNRVQRNAARSIRMERLNQAIEKAGGKDKIDWNNLSPEMEEALREYQNEDESKGMMISMYFMRNLDALCAMLGTDFTRGRFFQSTIGAAARGEIVSQQALDDMDYMEKSPTPRRAMYEKLREHHEITSELLKEHITDREEFERWLDVHIYDLEFSAFDTEPRMNFKPDDPQEKPSDGTTDHR